MRPLYRPIRPLGRACLRSSAGYTVITAGALAVGPAVVFAFEAVLVAGVTVRAFTRRGTDSRVSML